MESWGLKVHSLQYHHINQLESWNIYFQLEMLKSRLLTIFQIFCDSDCPCIIMNTDLKCIDSSISANKGFNWMLYNVEPDMSHIKSPAFSSIALSLYFTYQQSAFSFYLRCNAFVPVFSRWCNVHSCVHLCLFWDGL